MNELKTGDIFYGRTGRKGLSAEFFKVTSLEFEKIELSYNIGYEVAEDNGAFQKIIPAACAQSALRSSVSFPQSCYDPVTDIIDYDDRHYNIHGLHRYTGAPVKISCNPCDYFRVGDIFYNVRVNAYFYEIMKITDKSVKFAQICSVIVKRDNNGIKWSKPVPGQYLPEEKGRTAIGANDCKGILIKRFSSYNKGCDYFSVKNSYLERYKGTAVKEDPHWEY